MAPNSSKKDALQDMDAFFARMEKFSLKADTVVGYNFRCGMPYFWWTYERDGIQYIKVVMLSWGMHEKDINP
jgi:hypothetical protein